MTATGEKLVSMVYCFILKLLCHTFFSLLSQNSIYEKLAGTNTGRLRAIHFQNYWSNVAYAMLKLFSIGNNGNSFTYDV